MSEAWLNKLPLGKGVKVLKVGQGIIALNKPTGVRSHPNKPGADSKSLLTAPYDTDKQAYIIPITTQPKEPGTGEPRTGEPRTGEPITGELHLLHRLDAPTSGVILLAYDATVAKQVREAFRKDQVEKTYFAVTPILPSLRSPWKDRLARGRGDDGMVRVCTGAGDEALTIVTQVAASRTSPKLMLLKLQPKTGRTHQLRVQAAHRRIPILGDATYGNFAMNKRIAQVFGVKRLCLHAAEINVSYETGGKRASFSAKSAVPEEFNKLVKHS